MTTHPIIGDYPQPKLGQVVRDAERIAVQLLAVLRRDYDPTSAPSEDHDPTGAGHVQILLKCATADVHSALKLITEIADLDLPPVGSAVPFPARQDQSIAPARPDGPPSHPDPMPGESRSPGYDAASASAASGSGGAPHPSQATSSPGFPLGRPAAGPRSAVAPVAADESPGGFAAPGAGGSSDPRHVARSAGPDGPGRSAGVGPLLRCGCLMCSPRRPWPGTDAIAKSINEALTRRSL